MRHNDLVQIRHSVFGGANKGVISDCYCPMSVTAKQLSKTGARGKDLDSVVRENLQIIDDKLLRADRTWGRNVVMHDLPITLTLPGLGKKDAQRIIYTAILRSLDKRGFDVKILLTKRTTLYIAWMTDLDVEEVEAMNALIRAKRINENEVEEFVTVGTIAAPRAITAARQGRAAPAPEMKVAEEDRVMQPRGGVGLAPGTETRAAPSNRSTAEMELLHAGAS